MCPTGMHFCVYREPKGYFTGHKAGQVCERVPGCAVQDFNRRLREEQDAAYRESLAADREREREREAQRQAAAAAEAAAAEAAAAAQCVVTDTSQCSGLVSVQGRLGCFLKVSIVICSRL